MSLIITDSQNYSDIADAIRAKLGVQTTYLPSEMPDAIDAIPTGGGSDLGTKTITENGTYNASDDSLDGYSSVTVTVSGGGGAAITPHAFDLHTGYVSGGGFTYEGQSSSSYCDVYELESSTEYVLILGSPAGNRFRAMLSNTDPSTATSTVSGNTVNYDMNNPPAYSVKYFNSGSWRYLTVGKDNANTSGIKTYLYKNSSLANG